MRVVTGLKSRSRPRRPFLLIGIVLLTVIGLGASLMIWDLRRETIANYRHSASSLGIALAAHTSRSLQAIDLVLRAAGGVVAAAGADTPDDFKRLLGTEEIHRELAEQIKHLPAIDGIVLVADDGQVVNLSRAWPVPRIDLSDREYMAHFRDHDDAAVFISAPVKNRLTGTWSILVARRLLGPSKRPLGAALAVVEVGYLEEFFAPLAGPPDGTVSLLRRDGTLIARYPHDEAQLARKLPAASPWYRRVEAGSGMYHFDDAVDSTHRVAFAQPLDDYPLVIDVSRSEPALLAHWRWHSMLIGAGAVCALVGFALVLGMLAAQFRRVERSESSLAERNAALEEIRVKLERQTAQLARSAEALRRSEGRFRDFAQITSDWFWEQNEELRYTWFSDAVSRPGLVFDLIGLTRWEMVKEGVTEAQWTAHRAELAARQPFRDFRYIRTGEDGVIHHISVSGTPIFDDAGEFRGYRGAGREITDQIRAEVALRRATAAAEAAHAEAERSRRLAEETSRQLLEAQRIGNIGHWITDEATRTTTWSPQMFEIAGLPPGSAIPLDVARSPVHPDDIEAYLDTRRQAIAQGVALKLECRWVRPAGEIRWVHIQMNPEYDARGNCIRLFGTTQDITERKQSEEALKAAQRQLVDAIESMSDGFALFDRDDRYVLTNTNYRRLYSDRTDLFAPGTSYEEMLRGSAARGLQDLGGQQVEPWIRASVAWHRACGEAKERQLSDGRWIRAVERRTADGGIVAIRADITERKQAEQALKAAQRQMADAIDSISEGFALFDRDDCYVMTNENYRRLYPETADLFRRGVTFETVLRANVERNAQNL
ncbi:MAG: PAS-domain containing protein, partial [Alphaproteobacteria bacterium]|nr:PAS-domain containing protein [Alphaproteobacteria bacterium]